MRRASRKIVETALRLAATYWLEVTEYQGERIPASDEDRIDGAVQRFVILATDLVEGREGTS